METGKGSCGAGLSPFAVNSGTSISSIKSGAKEIELSKEISETQTEMEVKS